jgi:hypothetical protein
MHIEYVYLYGFLELFPKQPMNNHEELTAYRECNMTSQHKLILYLQKEEVGVLSLA